jgi:hypothetical protein
MRFKSLLVLVVALGFCPSVFGSTIAYTDGGDAGNNTGADNLLNIGREFSVTGTGITIDDLGVYAEDRSGNPISLSASHAVTLFRISSPGADPSNTELATTTVPAGTSAPYISGFRFAAITPTYLAPGDYAVIAYGLDNGNEAYGDGGSRLSSPNANDLGFDPYQFTSNASPSFPTVGDGGDHNGASFLFDVGNTVPEPSSLVALCGLGAVGLFMAARRRRKC